MAERRPAFGDVAGVARGEAKGEGKIGEEVRERAWRGGFVTVWCVNILAARSFQDPSDRRFNFLRGLISLSSPQQPRQRGQSTNPRARRAAARRSLTEPNPNVVSQGVQSLGTLGLKN